MAEKPAQNAKTDTVAAESKTAAATDTKPKTAARKPLADTDEIEIVSLIPHVSYKDKTTEDLYEWDDIGHTEMMTVQTIKNMWRSHKSYFRNLWLKITDDKVIKHLGLSNLYKQYEFLMEQSNYTMDNMSAIAEKLHKAPNGLKASVCSKIKSFVCSGELTDVQVIRKMETILGIDILSFLQ